MICRNRRLKMNAVEPLINDAGNDIATAHHAQRPDIFCRNEAPDAAPDPFGHFYIGTKQDVILEDQTTPAVIWIICAHVAVTSTLI